MHVGVGYSDTPNTADAGRLAAEDALRRAGRTDPCDLVLVFFTASHDAQELHTILQDIFGPEVVIVGGAATGAMVNEIFGYAGNQVGLAAFWLDGVSYELFVETGLDASEETAGKHLGLRLADKGVQKDDSLLLFYDAIDRSKEALRLVMATYLLQGIEKGLGFLPDIVGAGFQGDYIASATSQLTGHGVARHAAIGLHFSGEIRIDHIIMHGCRPATPYYTVTKAEEQTILEINGQPALSFIESLLGPSISVDEYPFFLTFGVNQGEKWGNFNENSYASRLCFAVDKERNAIIMFEPDMVAGTEFQVMNRTLDLNYMVPKVEQLFQSIGDRRPVFALYIDCAGRAAGYGGLDLEDAVVVQKALAGRVPLLGAYTGVEIASVEGKPRGLDWTGVFCLFSVPK